MNPDLSDRRLPSCVSAGCVGLGAFFVFGLFVQSWFWIGTPPDHTITVFDLEYWTHHWMAMLAGLICGAIGWKSSQGYRRSKVQDPEKTPTKP